jgi:hypothetical protein
MALALALPLASPSPPRAEFRRPASIEGGVLRCVSQADAAPRNCAAIAMRHTGSDRTQRGRPPGPAHASATCANVAARCDKVALWRGLAVSAVPSGGTYGSIRWQPGQFVREIARRTQPEPGPFPARFSHLRAAGVLTQRSRFGRPLNIDRLATSCEYSPRAWCRPSGDGRTGSVMTTPQAPDHSDDSGGDQPPHIQRGMFR